MKNMFRTLLFVAATAMAFSACTKDPSVENPVENPKKVSLRITPVDDANASEKSKADSRTEFGENYVIKWLNSDEIGVFINSSTPTVNSQGLVDRNSSTQMVSFITEVNPFLANDKLFAYYPYSTANNSGTPSQVSLAIPGAQAQEAVNKFNGSYNPLIGNPQVFATGSSDGIVSEQIKFYSLGAMIEVGLSTANSEYQGEVIRSLSFANSTAENIAGTFPYDITSTTGAILSAKIDKSKLTDASTSVTVSLPEASTAKPTATPSDNLLFMSLIPGTYTGDFTLVTDKATYTITNKTIEFPRAYVKRVTFNLDKATRTARVMGATKWEATSSSDLASDANTPKPVVTLGTPALNWNQTTTNPYFMWDATRGIQIGSSSNQATEVLTTTGYGDELQAVVINAAVAGSGNADISVYLDDKLTQTINVTATTSADYTFTPTAGVRSIASAKAGEIKIVMKSNVQKAMYLKSIAIIPANMVVTPLEKPVLTVEGTTVNWTAVTGAQGYEYTTDGGQTPVAVASGTSIDCAMWEPGTYSIQVRAQGDGVINSDSDWSVAANVTIENTATGGRYIKITSDQGDWSGQYLITYVKDDQTISAFSGQSGSNTYGAATDITNKLQSDNSIISDDVTNGYACTVERSANGYTIKIGTQYIGLKFAGKNLHFDTSAPAKTFEWNIIYNGEKKVFEIKNNNSDTYILQYNTSSPRFCCYEGSQAAITLYQLEDLTPRIVVADADKTQALAYDATSGSIAYVAKNLTGSVTATVTNAANNWFSASVASDKINWTAPANTGAARTATLTLSADGAESVVISVSQAAAPVQLATPAGLTVTADGAKVSASWTAVANASNYAWRIATGGTDVKTGTATTASVDITGLAASTTYTFYVKAVGDNVAYLTSTESSASVSTAAIPQLSMSDVTIKADATTGSSLTAEWTAVTNATGYKYKVTKTADGSVVKAETAVTGTSVAVADLAASTEYTIHVKAAGNGTDYVDSAYKTVNGTTTAVVELTTVDEAFTKFSTSGSSYVTTGNATSAAGSTWVYTNSRVDMKIGTALAVTFKNAAGPALSTTVNNQVKTISFSVAMPYSDTNVSVDLYINDSKVGSYTSASKTGTPYETIDVSAYTSGASTTKIEFKNGNAKRAAIGAISYQK